jgi:hypothetical protein
MKKRSSSPALPSFEEFRIRFVRVLEGAYRADPLIARILKDKVVREHCAALFWLTVNDSRERLAKQTTRRRTFLLSALEDAIRGAKAIEFVYQKLDPKPHLAEYMSTLRRDLLVKRQAVDIAYAPPKAYGRDRDWSAVRYAKAELESRLQASVSGATMADLLNASANAAGRKPAGKKAEVYAADVDAGLRRLNERTFKRVLPFYRQMLTEYYPLATDFSVVQ